MKYDVLHATSAEKLRVQLDKYAAEGWRAIHFISDNGALMVIVEHRGSTPEAGVQRCMVASQLLGWARQLDLLEHESLPFPSYEELMQIKTDMEQLAAVLEETS